MPAAKRLRTEPAWLRSYLRAVYAESLKLHRTSALALMTVTPFLVGLIFYLVARRTAEHIFRGDVDAWHWLTSSSLTLWTSALLPLLIALVATLVADVENRGNQWKHLFALPVPRGAVYAAKQTASLALVGLGMVLLTAFVWSAGRLLHLFNPELGFAAAFPWLGWTRLVLAVLAASGVLFALHTWVALRWKGFIPGIALAFLGSSVAGMLRMQEIWDYFPWLLSGHLVANLDGWSVDPRWTIAGVAGGLLLALAGGWDVVRRDVA